MVRIAEKQSAYPDAFATVFVGELASWQRKLNVVPHSRGFQHLRRKLGVGHEFVG